MNGSPLPILCRLHFGCNPFQLVDDEPVQQLGILEIAAPVLGEEVADEAAAGVGHKAG